MRERLVVRADDPRDIASTLSRFAQSGQADAAAVRGTAIEGDGSIVFVFSGNGSQWSGMGRAAYRCNAAFRDALAEIDSHFAPLSGWSLTEELASPNLKSDLAHTHIAQPMMFAIQSASVRALAEVGIRPSMTMGHSVGEVAAAEAAGVLSALGRRSPHLQPQPVSGSDRELRRNGGDIRGARRRDQPRRADSRTFRSRRTTPIIASLLQGRRRRWTGWLGLPRRTSCGSAGSTSPIHSTPS